MKIQISGIVSNVSTNPFQTFSRKKGSNSTLLSFDISFDICDEDGRVVVSLQGPASFRAKWKVAVDLYQKEKDKIDLITMDITMPHISGLHVQNLLNERGIRIPVIVVSADTYTVTERFDRLQARINLAGRADDPTHNQ